jgi:hypothetical protein
MRSSSVQSPVNFKSVAIMTVLSLTLSVAVPAAHAAPRTRSGKSSVTQPESTFTRVQRGIQRLIDRIISITGDLPADPKPGPVSSATLGGREAADPEFVVLP